jgi:hypothetical protein
VRTNSTCRHPSVRGVLQASVRARGSQFAHPHMLADAATTSSARRGTTTCGLRLPQWRARRPIASLIARGTSSVLAIPHRGAHITGPCAVSRPQCCRAGRAHSQSSAWPLPRPAVPGSYTALRGRLEQLQYLASADAFDVCPGGGPHRVLGHEAPARKHRGRPRPMPLVSRHLVLTA